MLSSTPNSILYSPSTKVKIRRADGKPVGFVEGDTFYKHVRASKHQLRIPPAWACDAAILNQALKLDAVWIVLKDYDANLTWKSRISAFWGKGSFEINRGYGRQRVLPLDYWNVSGETINEQLSFREMAAFQFCHDVTY
jgi:hypothetical protein